ncbi:MAG: VOC family protein [Candidatus Tyrphobacter sp.]
MTSVQQTITPLLWFANEAEEAARYYVKLFDNSEIVGVSRYTEAGPGKSGDAMMVEFTLAGQEFMALNGIFASDSAELQTPPRGAIALFVTCQTQAELDALWDRLGEGGKILQCGWLVDRYGVTWNIVPAGLSEIMSDEDPQRRRRAMEAMLKMKKIDLDAIRRSL